MLNKIVNNPVAGWFMEEYYRPELREVILKQAHGDFVAAYASRFARQFGLPLSRSVSILTQAREVERQLLRGDPSNKICNLPIQTEGHFPLEDFSVWLLQARQDVEIYSHGQVGFVLAGALNVDFPGSGEDRVCCMSGDVVTTPLRQEKAVYQCGGTKRVIFAIATIR